MTSPSRTTARNTMEAIPPVVKLMKPGSQDSAHDVILRIREEPVDLIEEGKKNYEYRAYTLHEEVKRIWLYEDHTGMIRLVLVIGGVKTPGQVNDPSGDGNDKFDRGEKESKFGYPIHDVLRLPYSLTRSELLDNYDIDMEDGRQYVKQKLVDVFPPASLEKIHSHTHM
ncbi:hypothetical protein LXA43DRAFT_1054486 [Ganoderma leucocontextum]|nr:hypothetical protein LXA43DRAFT_1054486 [Ganoderma leucocontextum]